MTRTDQRPSRSRRLLVGLATLLVATVTGTAAASPGLLVDDGTVEAMFTDASPLLEGYTVRSHGVQIGEVESISVEGGLARVRMRIDDRTALPLHDDATARIRPVSLLGERFVALDRGSPEAPVADPSAPIPVERTGSAVELDDVLDTVDQPTGKALSALITAGGEGVAGRGQDINSTLKALQPALGDTDRLLSVLREQNGALAGLIDNTAPVADALSANRGEDLNRLLNSTNLLLRTTAERSQALDATLTKLPGTLTEARTTLARLAGVSEQGTATLGALRPLTDQLPQITGELRGFSEAADPALAGLDPVLARGRELLDEAGPLVTSLRPAGPDLRGVAASGRPVVEELTTNLDDVLGFVRNWSMATNGYDGLSHYFRGVAILDPDTATGPVPAPVADRLPEPELPGPVDGALPQAPLPLPGTGGAPDAAPDTAPTDPDNATGLSPDQEQGLVGQLMGGS